MIIMYDGDMSINTHFGSVYETGLLFTRILAGRS